MRNGVMIISPWQPLGYRLFLWASFYITLLNYNKAKCNKRALRAKPAPRGQFKGEHYVEIKKTIMFINKIQIHKVICQDVFKQNQSTLIDATAPNLVQF